MYKYIYMIKAEAWLASALFVGYICCHIYAYTLVTLLIFGCIPTMSLLDLSAMLCLLVFPLYPNESKQKIAL